MTSRIFDNKKSKQRYLDDAFKIGLKRYLESLICTKEINADVVEHIFVFADEHTTATDGRYELREALENEFKIDTFNFGRNMFSPPVFPNIKDVQLRFCNSSSNLLVRAADIVANKVFHWARSGCSVENKPDIFIHVLP